MKIHIVTEYDHSVPEVISKKISTDVSFALSQITANSPTKFVINPTIWYNLKTTKKGAPSATPRVMNSADYISKSFGKNLYNLEWAAGPKEQTINNQTIDGYKEIETNLPFFKIPEKDFLDFFKLLSNQGLLDKDKSLRSNFNSLYVRYCSSSWYVNSDWPSNIKKYFIKAPSRKIKVGLEFETGNIASSFRALTKLDYLFLEGFIDLGVFVTSIDKASTATKIWPSSNRNGSFEELNKRNYKSGLTIPMFELGFQPDSFNNKAKYLGSDGSLYEPVAVKKEIQKIDDRSFQKFSVNNSPCWKEII